ncbi:TPA: hypothetical protein ACH3X1_007696 [Trebouxia sp. C0004]
MVNHVGMRTRQQLEEDLKKLHATAEDEGLVDEELLQVELINVLLKDVYGVEWGGRSQDVAPSVEVVSYAVTQATPLGTTAAQAVEIGKRILKKKRIEVGSLFVVEQGSDEDRSEEPDMDSTAGACPQIYDVFGWGKLKLRKVEVDRQWRSDNKVASRYSKTDTEIVGA